MSKWIESFGDALMLRTSANRKARHEGTNDERKFCLIGQQ